MDREELTPIVIEAASHRRSGRRIAFTIVTVLFALAAFGGLLGFELFAGWFDTSDGGIHRVHLIGFGVLYGVLLTTPLLAMTRRPEAKPSAFYQVVAVAVAALIAALIAADSSYLFLGAFVSVGAVILLVLHPARRELLHAVLNPSAVMGALVIGGSVPLVWFALTTARLQREGSSLDPHVSGDHWANMTAMAFGLLLVGLLASLRIRGWRFTAWCAGLGGAFYGLASIVFHRFPSTLVPYAGSEGVGWGLAAMIGGLAFIVIAEWESRRTSRA
jgi:hypothetical protein